MLLEVKDLVVNYGAIEALHGVSLNINEGELVAVVGHNGAGKTTTIKCVTGICDFNQGEIFIDGLNIKDNSLQCKKITAFVPDNPEVYEYLTGIQYLNFICDMYGVEKSERQQKIEYYTKEFGIYENLTELIGTYSHGMKQKLVLISAIIHNPKLIVLDEPFVGLDPVASFKIKNVMKELCANGASVFFSTHVLEVAEKLCDKIGIIKDGKLIACGTVKEVIGNTSLEQVFLELSNEQ